jgi:hypothetical protein
MLSMLLAITRSHHKKVGGPGYLAVGNLVVGLGMVLVLIQLDSLQLLFFTRCSFNWHELKPFF